MSALFSKQERPCQPGPHGRRQGIGFERFTTLGFGRYMARIYCVPGRCVGLTLAVLKETSASARVMTFVANPKSCHAGRWQMEETRANVTPCSSTHRKVRCGQILFTMRSGCDQCLSFSVERVVGGIMFHRNERLRQPIHRRRRVP